MIVSIKKLKQTNWIAEEPSAEESETVSLDFSGSSFETSGLAFPHGHKDEGIGYAPRAKHCPLADTNLKNLPQNMGQIKRGNLGNLGNFTQGTATMPALLKETGDTLAEGEASPSTPATALPALFQSRVSPPTRWVWLALSLCGHLAVLALGYVGINLLFQHAPL